MSERKNLKYTVLRKQKWNRCYCTIHYCFYFNLSPCHLLRSKQTNEVSFFFFFDFAFKKLSSYCKKKTYYTYINRKFPKHLILIYDFNVIAKIINSWAHFFALEMMIVLVRVSERERGQKKEKIISSSTPHENMLYKNFSIFARVSGAWWC